MSASYWCCVSSLSLFWTFSYFNFSIACLNVHSFQQVELTFRKSTGSKRRISPREISEHAFPSGSIVLRWIQRCYATLLPAALVAVLARAGHAASISWRAPLVSSDDTRPTRPNTLSARAFYFSFSIGQRFWLPLEASTISLWSDFSWLTFFLSYSDS